MYAVVDGKQRLQTLFTFVEDEIALASNFGDARFDGKKWSQIDEKQIFWNYVVPVEFLTFDPNDPQEVNQAFDRLNRNMRNLEPQELRHARWDGWLIRLIERESDLPFWRSIGISTTARVKRMREAQFISELLLVVIQGRQIGFDQQALDAAYARYNDLDELEDEAVNPDEVTEKMEAAKTFISETDAANSCIKTYAKTLAIFYTVWCLVVLHRDALPPAPEFAQLCEDFFVRFKELNEAENPLLLLEGTGAERYKRVAEFETGYRGASTDLAQRTKRLEALLAFIQEA